jgi:hypothetical protein
MIHPATHELGAVRPQAHCGWATAANVRGFAAEAMATRFGGVGDYYDSLRGLGAVPEPEVEQSVPPHTSDLVAEGQPPPRSSNDERAVARWLLEHDMAPRRAVGLCHTLRAAGVPPAQWVRQLSAVLARTAPSGSAGSPRRTGSYEVGRSPLPPSPRERPPPRSRPPSPEPDVGGPRDAADRRRSSDSGPCSRGQDSEPTPCPMSVGDVCITVSGAPPRITHPAQLTQPPK